MSPKLRASNMHAMGERAWRIAVDRGGALVLSTLILYVVVAPTHIVDGDNAEFSTLGAIGGTAHPSGYPLYLMWLRVMAWLPGQSPAHTAALATAILAAVSTGMLHAACRAWGGRTFGATLAVAVFAAAPIIMRISTEAEVFALNGLIAATVLWLSATRGPLRGIARAVALGAVAGFGMSNHMTCTLLAPIGILGAVRGVRESGRPLVAVASAIGGLVLGLTPYLYLLATPDTAMSWGKVHDFNELIAMILRRDYGGPGAFLPGTVEVPITTRLLALASTLGRTWLWAGLFVGVASALMRTVRLDDTESRWAWAAWLGTWLLAGPLLASRFNIDPAGLGLYVCQRFYMLPALLLTVPVAVALRRIDGLVERSSLGVRRSSALVATVGFLAIASTSLSHLARTHTPAVEQYARNMLRAMPNGAVVFIGQDDEYFGIGYVQWALGERQDVVAVAPLLTGMPWYAQRVAARGVFAPPGDGPPLARAIEHLLATGHPVFVEKSRADIIGTFPTYPYGTWMKVLPRGTSVPSVEQVVAENKDIYSHFELGYPRPGGDDEFATAIHHRYAATWKTLSRKAEQLGNHELAAAAAELADQIGPTK
jgi:hypothetical protein